jgi:protein TonB
MNDGPTEISAETPPLTAGLRLPEEQPSALSSGGMEEGSLAASFNLHAVVILALLAVALIGFFATPEPEPALKVTLISLGPGSAGASGGAGGGGGETAEAQTPPARPANAETQPNEARAAEATEPPHQTEPDLAQIAEASSPLPAELPPPPRRKPPATRPTSAAARTTLDQTQVAAVPLDMPVPGAPGLGSGPGGKTGLGTGAAGDGRGARGAGPITGPGDDYLDRVRRWLNKYKHFPEEAQKQKQHGQLVVSFTILRDGTVRDPHVERSSGFPLLDAAALQMLHDASPVPPLPETYRAPQVAVDLPVEFTIGFLDRIF